MGDEEKGERTGARCSERPTEDVGFKQALGG